MADPTPIKYGTLTRGEYMKELEEKGHSPYWKPERRHLKLQAEVRTAAGG